MPRTKEASKEIKHVQRVTQKKQDAQPWHPNQSDMLDRQTPSIKHTAVTTRPRATYRDSFTQTIGRYKAVKPAATYSFAAVQTLAAVESILPNLPVTTSILDAADTTPDSETKSASYIAETPSSPSLLNMEAHSVLSSDAASIACENPHSPELDTLQLLVEDNLCTVELRAWEHGIASAPGPEEQHRYAMMLKAEIEERGIAGIDIEMLESVMQNYS